MYRYRSIFGGPALIKECSVFFEVPLLVLVVFDEHNWR